MLGYLFTPCKAPLFERHNGAPTKKEPNLGRSSHQSPVLGEDVCSGRLALSRFASKEYGTCCVWGALQSAPKRFKTAAAAAVIPL